MRTRSQKPFNNVSFAHSSKGNNVHTRFRSDRLPVSRVSNKCRKGSDQLISTLQDIRSGRQTEIEFLNLEIARVAASMQPRLDLPRIELLGKMILVKSLQHRRKGPQDASTLCAHQGQRLGVFPGTKPQCTEDEHDDEDGNDQS
jgi:hypothetical protein